MLTKRTLLLRLLAALVAAIASVHAHAGCREVPAMDQLSGKGQLCILGFCLYDAQLWSATVPANYGAPFALEITYRRAITRARLIETAADEIQRLGAPPPPETTLARWKTAMEGAFIDVKPGDRLCGVYLPGRGARFYANGQPTTEVADPAFAHAFFDIWLAPGTRAPALRRQLLGETR